MPAFTPPTHALPPKLSILPSDVGKCNPGRNKRTGRYGKRQSCGKVKSLDIFPEKRSFPVTKVFRRIVRTWQIWQVSDRSLLLFCVTFTYRNGHFFLGKEKGLFSSCLVYLFPRLSVEKGGGGRPVKTQDSTHKDLSLEKKVYREEMPHTHLARSR